MSGYSWNYRPQDYIEAAKAKAKQALEDPSLGLTRLERAFLVRLKQTTNEPVRTLN